MRRLPQGARHRAATARGGQGGWRRAAALLAALVLLPFLAAPLAAQPVPVRGGEHAGFTRLVLTIPPSAPWDLAPVPGGFALTLPAGARFDLSRAFDRIGRSRVAALSPEGEGRLRLDIPCDCHAEAFLFRPGGLVIDVADGPGALRPGGAPAPSVAAGDPRPALPLLPPRLPAEPLPGVFAAQRPAPPFALAPLAPAETERAAEAEAAVLEGLARAATQGLLDLAPSADMAPVADPTAPPALPERPASAVAAPLAPPAPAPRPGVAIRTASDGTDPAAPPPLGATGERCLPPEAFDLAAWAGGDDFGTALAPRLAAVTDGRDRPDPAAAEDLARAWVAWGFGREARQALTLAGGRSAARDRLLLLARLVDGETADPAPLEGQAGCLGPVALWHALARGSVAGLSEPERVSVTAALRALPRPLRATIAPRLAALFLQAGDPAEAEAALALAPEAVAGPAALVAAAVTEAAEGPEAARTRLLALARSDARLPPEALARLLDLERAATGAVPEDLLSLARALRAEAAGGEGAQALLLAEARALSAMGLHGEALGLLATEGASLPDDTLRAAQGEAVATFAAQASDAAFLALALGGLPPDLPGEPRLAVARRLLAMGFPPEALAALGEGGGVPGRLLRAEAALALGDPLRAEAALAGLAGPEAEALRVQARGLAAQGAATGAVTLGFPVAGVALSRPAAALALPPPDAAAPATLPPLAARRALLDEAAATRARAAALLAGEAGG